MSAVRDSNEEQFALCAGDKIKLTHDQKVVNNLSNRSASIYGRVLVPNKSSKSFKWQLKCLKYGAANYWAVGICCAQNRKCGDYYYNGYHKSYAYQADGYIYDCGTCISKTTPGWNAGDKITLCYQGMTIFAVLWISINGEFVKESILIVENNTEGYTMAVLMGYERDGIEIIGFESNDCHEIKSDEDTQITAQLQVFVYILALLCISVYLRSVHIAKVVKVNG